MGLPFVSTAANDAVGIGSIAQESLSLRISFASNKTVHGGHTQCQRYHGGEDRHQFLSTALEKEEEL